MSKILVTGCGRSGTGYLSNCLNSCGVKCGHEDVFTYNGFAGWKDYEGDSSWFAAPYIKGLEPEVKIIHIVRHPDKVVQSFYRLGVFSRLGWRNFIINPSPMEILKRFILNPKNIYKRYLHVSGHRKILKENSTSQALFKSEILKIYDYWYDWNLMIERNSKNKDYLRIKIEEIDSQWSEVEKFINSKIEIDTIIKKNKKNNYPERNLKKTYRPEYIDEMKKRYGYV